MKGHVPTGKEVRLTMKTKVRLVLTLGSARWRTLRPSIYRSNDPAFIAKILSIYYALFRPNSLDRERCSCDEHEDHGHTQPTC